MATATVIVKPAPEEKDRVSLRQAIFKGLPGSSTQLVLDKKKMTITRNLDSAKQLDTMMSIVVNQLSRDYPHLKFKLKKVKEDVEVEALINKVAEGHEPLEVLEKHYPGMVNASCKPGHMKKECDCGCMVPQYTGRYPKACPHCGKDL